MSDNELRGAGGPVLWRSRRGMLELDLELVPFARDRFNDLSAADQAAYVRLLGEDDWRIHDWLRGRSNPGDAALDRIVSIIRKARDDGPANANQR